MVIEASERTGFHRVTFSWSEDDPGHPAKEVLVRLIALTDHAQDDGALDPHLLLPGEDGHWSLTVELPSDLRTSYQLCPLRDEPLRGRVADEHRWTAIMAAGIADPRNQTRLPAGCTYGNRGQASILELPAAPPSPRPVTSSEAGPGKLQRHRFGSSAVSVYAPAELEGPAALAVLFDGRQWIDLGIAGLLDQLNAGGRIAPMIAVLVESIGGRPRLETLTRPEVFLPFLTDELLPFMRSRWPVSTAPGDAMLIGQSLGGLAATWAAWSRPDLFGAVIGQSTSFWWPGNSGGSDSSIGLVGPDVIEAISAGPPAPIRFFLEAGSTERDLLDGNRQLAKVLAEQGYKATYREYQGGHDYACWRANLLTALAWTATRHPTASQPPLDRNERAAGCGRPA